MLIRFACPACRRTLKVSAQFAGRCSKCPGCGQPVTVPAAADPEIVEPAIGSPAPAEPEGAFTAAAQPVPPASAGFDFHGDADSAAPLNMAAGWGSVQGGLKLVRIGSIVYIAASIIMVTGFLCGISAIVLLGMEAGSGPPSSRSGSTDAALGGMLAGVGLMLVIMGLYILAALAASILRIVGFVQCLQVPPDTGAQPLTIGALICEVTILLSPALAFMAGMVHDSLGNLVQLLNLATMVVGLVLLLVFLRKIGTVLDSEPLCRQVVHCAIWIGGYMITVLVGSCLMVGVFLTMMGVGISMASQNRPSSSEDFATTVQGMGVLAASVVIIYALVAVIGWLIVAFKYVGLLRLAADVIGRRLRQARGV